MDLPRYRRIESPQEISTRRSTGLTQHESFLVSRLTKDDNLSFGVNHEVKIVVLIGVDVAHSFLVRLLLPAVAKVVGLSIFKPCRVVAIKL